MNTKNALDKEHTTNNSTYFAELVLEELDKTMYKIEIIFLLYMVFLYWNLFYTFCNSVFLFH